MTTATSPLPTSLRRTACQPTAIGSVSTATSGARPLGTGKASDSSTTTCSAYAPGALADSPVGCTPPGPRSSGTATTGVPSGAVAAAPRSARHDLAAELVAEHHLLVGAHEVVVLQLGHQPGHLVGVRPRVQVGAADAAALDVQEQLAAAGHGVGPVPHRELTPGAGDRLHGGSIPL